MKPTQQQQDFIKERLKSMTYVQETYEELYDHVLTALEDVLEDVSFMDEVQRIIQDDFGGKRGIRSMQRRFIRIAIKDFLGAYFLTFSQSFKSVSILLVIAATIVYCLVIKNEWITPQDTVIYLTLSLLPAVLVRRKKNRGYNWEAHKTNYVMYHVGGYASALMVPFPFLLWDLTTLLGNYLTKIGMIEWLPGNYRAIPMNMATVNLATAFFFIALLHAVTFYKMSKNFPMQGIVN